ncbi:oral cancer-overexpressed protein 1-like [Lingula anatina]|uniref:Oral cancer-overexpressed protein 1-like n=1 Tax=Lingula anatina TaxID=7574 RepID=A0A1S3HPV1_LINAN|nr:oral cancer-overexpressed protein 1-like [Lingula anatina]|eukprot:XP_013388078.1 oral cancer-overexpressed protein 1-like [Lingula anatina]
MATPLDELDVNSCFDDIALAENKFQSEGFTEGLQTGRTQGYNEGYMLGKEKGADMATEIGFYDGYTGVMKSLIEESTNEKTRKLKALESLQDMIQSFPLRDPSYERLHSDLEKIRAKFKQVCSLLNVKPQFQNSSVKGISF